MTPGELDAVDQAGILPLIDVLARRRVALVGNAASLLACDHGAAIENCDLVVRLNRGVPPNERSHGARTDILLFSVMHEVREVIDRFDARWRVWMSPRRRPAKRPEGILFHPDTYWEAANAKLGSRPSTGYLALTLLERATQVDAHLFGFDFKATKTFYREQDHIGPHDFAREAVAVQEICRQRQWRIY